MRVETPWRVCSLGDGFSRLLFLSRAIGGRLRRPPKHVRGPCYNADMQNDILTSLTRLSDAELVARVKSLVARERDATAQLVAHLAELDTRDVYLREGYGSLYAYCRGALGLSDGETCNRIEVARAARRFPVILDMLAAGVVTLTAVRLLAPRLTAANHREVLESALGKKKSEIEEIVARLAPRPDVRASVRRLPAVRVEVHLPAEAATNPAAEAAVASSPSALDPAAPLAPAMPLTAEPTAAPRAAVTPLSPDRYKLQLTIGGDTLEKLRLAKDMLSHAIPSGDDAAVLDRALTLLLVDLAKKKFAGTPKPRPSRARDPRARQVSAAVKRAVWVRDLGRCAFIGTTGHRCNERRFVEFHHVDAHALGGEATVDNIALRCRRHNDYEGRLYFGKRRRDVTGAAREEAVSHGPQPSAPANLFRNRWPAEPRRPLVPRGPSLSAEVTEIVFPRDARRAHRDRPSTAGNPDGTPVVRSAPR
jgi:hypothetical protein